MSTFTLTAVGETALETIRQEQTASVMGLTSRGVFCSTRNGQIFFLSYEDWHGPLTLNLNLESGPFKILRYRRKEQDLHPPPFDRLTHGSDVKLLTDTIQFESEDITICIAGTPTWKAAVHPLPKDVLADARIRLKSVAHRVSTEGSGAGWVGGLPRWAGFAPKGESAFSCEDLDNELQNLNKELHTGNGEEFLLKLGRLLGRGTGLTPSGDDFVIGLLLSLRSAKEILPVWCIGRGLYDRLILLAQEKTTTLSANLIACAVNGQADERLTSALEGILLGNLSVEECARRLIDYGGSSGGDSLLGIAVALSHA